MSFLAAVLLLAAAPAEPALMIPAADLPAMKTAARQNPLVRKLADQALRSGPWSVTYHRPSTHALDPHDYFSEGPYWWPDPKNPGGPYIRRDGERNPDRFEANRRDLGAMANAVLALGMCGYFLDDTRCVEHGSKLLKTWFVDEKTRMNANLEHGQAVRGHNDGRGIGIIDTVSLIYAVQGASLLERTGRLDGDVAQAVRKWFADYLKWMTTSKKGRDEERAENNHGAWWTAQVAAFASYIGDEPAMKRAWNRYRTVLVPTHFQADGSAPREEARTRSLSYSTFNLDAFAVICRVAEARGENLWSGMKKSVEYLTPFVLEPQRWKKPQITPFEADRPVFLALAGLGLREQAMLAAHRKLPRAESPWVVLVELMVKAAR